MNRDQVQFREDRHDADVKTILGKTDNFNADSFATLLLQHPATSQRLAWRLCDTMMGEGVAETMATEQLARGLTEHDLDVGWAVETILRSELFFSDANIASRVSCPVEFVLGAARSLELLENPPSTLILAEWCTRLGQDLFYPPNVGGWSGGRGWLTSRTIVGRANFAAALVAGELKAPPAAPPLRELATKCGVSEKPLALVDFFEALLLGTPTAAFDGKRSGDLQQLVARLLSRPEAQLT